MPPPVEPGAIRVGMSGFSYKEWVGDFYPPRTKPADMLAYYATRFPAVEINTTFRRQAAPSTIERWRDAVPEGFRFTVKAHQLITHWRKLADCTDDVIAFTNDMRPLGERLGPLLFQTPPTLALDADVLDAFCASLPAGFAYAFEPRHESFAGTQVDEILAKHGVVRCCNDDVHALDDYRPTGRFAYLRFHREAPYTPDELAERADFVRRLGAGGIDVYAFFAHEDDPESIRPALRMQELLAGA